MRSPPPDDCPFWRSFGLWLLLAMSLPMGPLSFRLHVGPFPIALECVMIATVPEVLLISFPIQTP